MNIAITAPKRLYQEIGLALQERIQSDEFKIGDRLPPERDIAEEMEVSRSVVREAIIMLELQGLVEVRKGSGVYVNAKPLLMLSNLNWQRLGQILILVLLNYFKLDKYSKAKSPVLQRCM